jgi:hypothetical protein
MGGRAHLPSTAGQNASDQGTLGRPGAAEAVDDHFDHVPRERVIEWLVTVQQAVARGAVQEIQGDLGVGIGVRIVRRRAADPAAFPPERQERILAAVMASITRKKNLNPKRRHRTYPRVVKRARHNSYRVKNPATTAPATRPGPAKLANLRHLGLAA